MMRPMKLAGEYLLFGNGALEYLKTIKGEKAFIIISGGSIERSGYLKIIQDYLSEAGIQSSVFKGVEPDPSIHTVLKGAEEMKRYNPDWIIGLGGGSAMDAAKAMWIFYEHPHLKTLQDISSPNIIPALRGKAKMICIPTTSGSASEVSRSIVITDPEKNIKVGIGNMEMMPDIALLEPGITSSMPEHITADTGIDALTHALEAYVSNRSNDLSDTLSEKAALEIFKYLPLACSNGENILYREKMQNFSMIAGIAFTNVSLGIVHSMAHTVGGKYGVAHGLADGIILPYVIEYNMQNAEAKKKYDKLAKMLGGESFAKMVRSLNEQLNIPSNLKEVINKDEDFEKNLEELATMAKNDGCTKTNPIIPDIKGFQELFRKAYYGK
ncbi:iron-containing alcohol dehydrogenase [Clostridium rectalis]|uniref:iron-containing alcohol dehydrogenase n=1 Tax=Clostridium rectalis TaxID=2040295 RepID=UPI000F6307EC|nr:iron-containing alcohol dehydrogenase [Clostridium rectalis]